MDRTSELVSYSLPQLLASDDLAMLTASPRWDRLLLDFRAGGEGGCSYGDDQGFLVLDGHYFVETDAGSLHAAPYDVYEQNSGRLSPFYFRIPANAKYRMFGNGIYQHAMPGPASERRECTPDNCVDLKPIRMIRTSEEAFHISDPIVTVSRREINVLKAELPNTARKRIRLCCHANSLVRLHEMFVLYTKQTYIQPNKHLAKDETFLILEGEADFIFYSDSGDVTKIIPLGSPESGRAFFVRVPQGVYHSVVMHSDFLVIHEATPGPYDREHTVWAPWAKSQKLS